MARTDTLGNFLTDVANAIRTKGGTSSQIQASTFDTAIANIPSGGGAKIKPKNISFNYLTEQTFDLSNLDTSNITNMNNMFAGCSNLTTLDLSSFNTSNATNMGSMFNGCSNLTTLDISNFDFTNVSEYATMFRRVPYNCLIYVKDQTAKDWIESKFSGLTNVQIKS